MALFQLDKIKTILAGDVENKNSHTTSGYNQSNKLYVLSKKLEQ